MLARLYAKIWTSLSKFRARHQQLLYHGEGPSVETGRTKRVAVCDISHYLKVPRSRSRRNALWVTCFC